MFNRKWQDLLQNKSVKLYFCNLFRNDRGRDDSQHYLKHYEDNPSKENEEVSSYYLGTLSSSKNSGLSSSCCELSQYINGAEAGDQGPPPAHTSEAGELKWMLSFPLHIVFVLTGSFMLLSHQSFHLYITCQLLSSTPSLMRSSASDLRASWYGSLQDSPHRRTSASWRSTVLKWVQHLVLLEVIELHLLNQDVWYHVEVGEGPLLQLSQVYNSTSSQVTDGGQVNTKCFTDKILEMHSGTTTSAKIKRTFLVFVALNITFISMGSSSAHVPPPQPGRVYEILYRRRDNDLVQT